MPTHRIEDVAYKKVIRGLVIKYPENKAPKVVWNDRYIEIKNEDFTVLIDYYSYDEEGKKRRKDLSEYLVPREIDDEPQKQKR